MKVKRELSIDITNCRHACAIIEDFKFRLRKEGVNQYSDKYINTVNCVVESLQLMADSAFELGLKERKLDDKTQNLRPGMFIIPERGDL